MERLARILTDYVVGKKAVPQEEYELYRYGFQAGLEMLSCAAVGFIIAVRLGMAAGYLCFLAVFAALRSYTGGLHMDHFWSCFLCSCAVMAGALLWIRTVSVKAETGFVITLLLAAAIRLTPPQEHPNRPVDGEEKRYFKKMLNRSLILILAVSAVFTVLRKERLVESIAAALAVTLAAMIAGRVKERL